MLKSSTNSVLSIASIVLIFVLSFRAFAGFLTPNFDSDQAVHVLMAYDLRLPEDLYYWGQNRLGSLLPILSHWLLRISSLTPIEAVSYVQYVLLTVGFLCFTSLFKKNITRVVFALIWFLPPDPFLKLIEVAHPYAAQFSLLGIALVFANKLIDTSDRQTIQKICFSLIILFSLVLSIWVSDLSLVPAFLAIVWVTKTVIKRNQSRDRTFNFSKLIRANLIYVCVLIALLLGSAFLVYAKSTASATNIDYGVSAINSLGTLAHVTRSMLSAISRTFLFQVGNPFLSWSAIASVASILVLIRGYQRARHNANFIAQLRWIPFLLISAIGTLFLILLSRWTYIQETPSRYFIGIYIFCWISALLVFDNLDRTRRFSRATLNRVSALLVVTALLGSLSLPNYVFAIEKPQSRLSMLQPIAALGKVGFIGDYWTSYLMCIVAPERTSCTPHQQDFVRCSRCVESVLESPTIYLVDRDWLNEFPDEIEQFGHRLKKQKPARRIAGYLMAPYRNVDR